MLKMRFKGIYLLICMMLFPTIVFANGTKVGNLFYLLDEQSKTAQVTYSTHSDPEFEMPNYGGLQTIDIPKSIECNGDIFTVTSIGRRAFYHCSGLNTISISETITSIGEEAFSGCSSLNITNISDLNSWIGIDFADLKANPLFNNSAKYLYLDGKAITDLALPNSVQTIGNYTFAGYSGLQSISIPTTVSTIGDLVFYMCSGLNKIEITDLDAWLAIDFKSSNSNPLSTAQHLYLNGEEVKTIKIPETITTVRNYAFYGCTSITSVEMTNSVESIGNWAFYGCSGLLTVSLSESLSTIGDSAFFGCSNLESIEIPKYVTSIPTNTFYNCKSLKTITFNSDQELKMGSQAFGKCESIEAVYCKSEIPPVSNEFSVFANSVYSNATLYVLNTVVDLYESTIPWSNFVNISGIDEFPETGASSIADLSIDASGVFSVYMLNGVCVTPKCTLQDLDSLRPGIYIVNRKKIIVR